MENGQIPLFNVSDFLAVVNQSLDLSIGVLEVVGEVASFKRSQQKYIFFDLKDLQGSVNCFMMEWQLRTPLEDGMKVIVRGSPKLTTKGKFSLTVQAVRLVGEGSIKKSFDLLKTKLQSEGLFSEDRKRSLPAAPEHIGVITSTQAAGYADFEKIINDRWSGMRVDVAHVQVQGDVAADQIIRAIDYFNAYEPLPDVLVIIRGGGSLDDLAVFNDEKLVRKLAASRIPTLVGVGHETDETLADMAADVRAATPSNAAQIIAPDKRQIMNTLDLRVNEFASKTLKLVDEMENRTTDLLFKAVELINNKIDFHVRDIETYQKILHSFNPTIVLEKGYALVRGEMEVGRSLEIETSKLIVKAKIEEKYEK